MGAMAEAGFAVTGAVELDGVNTCAIDEYRGGLVSGKGDFNVG